MEKPMFYNKNLINDRTINIIIFLALFIIVGYLKPILAVQWEQRERYKDIVSLKGTCETDVTVYLVPKTSEESVYSGGVRCINGQFEFKDDLREWNIPKGTYRMLIGQENKKDFNHIEEIESTGERKIEQQPQPASVSSAAVDQNPDNRFATGVQNFFVSSHSLTDQITKLRTDLAQTTLSDPIKNLTDSFLSIIEDKLTGVFDTLDKIVDFVINPSNNKKPEVTPSATPSAEIITPTVIKEQNTDTSQSENIVVPTLGQE